MTNTKPLTLNSQLSTLNSQLSTLNSQLSTLLPLIHILSHTNIVLSLNKK